MSIINLPNPADLTPEELYKLLNAIHNCKELSHIEKAYIMMRIKLAVDKEYFTT